MVMRFLIYFFLGLLSFLSKSLNLPYHSSFLPLKSLKSVEARAKECWPQWRREKSGESSETPKSLSLYILFSFLLVFYYLIMNEVSVKYLKILGNVHILSGFFLMSSIHFRQDPSVFYRRLDCGKGRSGWWVERCLHCPFPSFLPSFKPQPVRNRE